MKLIKNRLIFVFSLLLAVMTVYSFAPCAFAAEETTAVTADETTTTITEEETTATEKETTEIAKSEGNLLGDLNCDGVISSDEARKVLRFSVSLDELPDMELVYAEMNGDGTINSSDARLILRSSVKLEKEVRHDFTDLKVTKSTCETGGKFSYKCSICEKNYSFVVKAKGHRYVETGRVNATCVTDGKLTEKCSVCDKLNEKIYKSQGHKWLNATATTPKTCRTCKTFVAGFNEVGEKTYYFNPDGTVTAGEQIQKLTYNGVTADWYLKDGELLKTFRGAETINGTDYIVTEGKVQKVVTEEDKTLFRAFKEVAKATTPEMTKEQKLKACFDYCKTAYRECRPRTPHYTGMDWPVVYANDMFVGTGGNCFSYAAAFAYMAKAIGYENVYCCNTGGHGWAEIDGLVYDPEWSIHYHRYTYYALSYDTKTDVNYKGALTKVYPWMYVKI